MAEKPYKPRRTIRGTVFRLLACIVLIPFIAAMVAVFPRFMKLEITPLWLRGPRQVAVAFFSGAGLYLLLHIFLHRPITAYLFAHELSHAIWSRITGKRVKKVEVKKGSGRTVTTGGNWLIRLAPYCVPLYTVLLIAIWTGLQFTCPSLGRYMALLFAGIGFTYAFHVLLTLHFLKVGQDDLHSEGYCFSLAMILAANLEVAAAVYAAISHRAGWWRFQVMVWECLRGWGHYWFRGLG